jgi:TM2 domain-containing membrane protein YozV
MMFRFCPVLLFILFTCFAVSAKGEMHNVPGKTIFIKVPGQFTASHTAIDSTTHRKHRLWAALLAFPLGVFGLHRMYLGSSPAMPLVYIATLGGGFGILPFIDFVLILMNKDVNTYANSPSLFMWSKRKEVKK